MNGLANMVNSSFCYIALLYRIIKTSFLFIPLQYIVIIDINNYKKGNNMKKLISILLSMILFVSVLSIGRDEVHAKTVKAPSKFETSSEEYSNTLTWNKVKGVTGYVLYLKNDDGKFVKEYTTKHNSIIHSNLEPDTEYSYKVKSYIKKKNKTTYSKYSKTITIRTQVKTEQNLYTFMTTEARSNVKSVGIFIKNKSSKKIEIQETGYLVDSDYSSFTRSLTLVKIIDDKITYPKSIIIEPDKSEMVLFKVKGDPTWYDKDSTMVFDYNYSGKLFRHFANTFENSLYIETEIQQ